MLRFLVFFFLLLSCRLDGDKAVDRNKFSFRTGDDTELFFKNLRQSYYDLEELKSANLNVFRLKNRSGETDRPVVNVAIVMNWVQDEAYILVEPGALLQDELSLKVYWKDTVNNETGAVVLEGRGKENMLEFASQLYEGIVARRVFQIEHQEQLVNFLHTPEDREAIRITMSDYYRLTRVF